MSSNETFQGMMCSIKSSYSTSNNMINISHSTGCEQDLNSSNKGLPPIHGFFIHYKNCFLNMKYCLKVGLFVEQKVFVISNIKDPGKMQYLKVHNYLDIKMIKDTFF